MLEPGDGAYLLSWFDVETAEFVDAKTLPMAAWVNLESPAADRIWLALIEKR